MGRFAEPERDESFSPINSARDRHAKPQKAVLEAEAVLNKLENFSVGTAGKENATKATVAPEQTVPGLRQAAGTSANRQASPVRTRSRKPPALTITALPLPHQAAPRSTPSSTHDNETTAAAAAAGEEAALIQAHRTALDTAHQQQHSFTSASSSSKPQQSITQHHTEEEDAQTPIPSAFTKAQGKYKGLSQEAALTTPSPSGLLSKKGSSTPSSRSPGALLRQSSQGSLPAPYPLPDLLCLVKEKHTVPMEKLIHSMASLSRAGKEQMQRKTNQDTVFAYKQFLKPYQALCGVMDGHGPNGHTVSGFANKQLPSIVASQLRKKGEHAAAVALTTAFTETHAAVRSAGSALNARLSGTTAVVSLLQGMRLTTAWVGDSRAILVRSDTPTTCRGIPLTDDHKPISASELSRILAAGGRVERLSDAYGEEVGPHRVWLPGSWVPGLAMSRTIGDLVAQSVGVVADPDVVSVDLHHQDKFLILASDGVWEFISVQEAAEIVYECESAEEACTMLVNAANAKWEEIGEGVIDDISVVAVCFNNT